MQIVHSRKVEPVKPSQKIVAALDIITESTLREWVERISVPRHFQADSRQNRAVASWLCDALAAEGTRIERCGRYSNIVALTETSFREVVLVGAHYDSVPGCPGADDNGSAVAALLACASVCQLWRPQLPVVFVAFNCEEDGLLGSRDFVASELARLKLKIRCAHILEMVGYASSVAGSQRVPPGLPIRISDTGDFLGLLANGASTAAMDFVLRRAGAYAPGLPVTGLNVKLGLEKYFPVLSRSDHAPFWEQKIPAVMWTDTSEFRNRNYHCLTDTPDTLNYRFLRQVAQLLTACVIQQAEQVLSSDD
jgi:Zn-dependent M28 family amino/carboxypeptidase